ncbi:uncharacterized protein [Littorina saxatilis]|uniref:Uncharacterized protein n=1 Tax=Littorina saxatilis TaxID=31220 RepID=A0AAN9B5D7_9CAEN
MEYALQMEIWKGNISGAIQIARERAKLSDWIVSLAPLASYDTWVSLCEEYAEQLEEDGQYHKAVSYLLASHKPYPAIDLFRRHKLFREAVALARVRLSPLDPVLEDLYTEWSQQLMLEGAYEQAAKCYLAMKSIKDAAQVITRRSDQSSLQAACNMTLVANEKQQGQLLASQAVTRYLLNHQWNQCLEFLNEHQPLKVFIPYVSVHEMVMRELMTLSPDLVATEECCAAATWDTTPADSLGIPEFILDPKEAEPVLPWEPYLIAGHTFPHHVLRVWHLHLGVTMETEQLHLAYHVLQQLQSGRQAHLDTQQALLQVCADITLWLLALLTNQTSLAISHLLGALSALNEGGHHKLLTALCRLLLPQGPKYTLKLQQETTAMRVLINIESQVDVEGGGKHLSLRRYLSELKEEPSVSTGALRCRQLDCVRAYYYLSVLHYLQEDYSNSSKDACRPESQTSTQNVDTGQSEGQKTGELGMAGVNSADGSSAEKAKSITEKSGAGSTEKTNSVCASGAEKTGKVGEKQDSFKQVGTVQSHRDEDGGATDGTAGQDNGLDVNGYLARDGGSSVDMPRLVKQTGDSGDCDDASPGVAGKKAKASGDSSVDSKTGDATATAKSCEGSQLQEGSVSGEGVGSTEGPWHLSLQHLLQLSKGLLWDIQAKSLALTETLGHIHHAISQHLLTDRSREAAKTLSRHPNFGNSHHHHHSALTLSSFAPVLADTVASHLPVDPWLDIDDPGAPSSQLEAGVSAAAEAAGGDIEAERPVNSNSAVLSPPPVPPLPSLTSPPSPSVPSTDSAAAAEKSLNTKEKKTSQLDSMSESNFDLYFATLGQLGDGSRRVLWRDDPISGTGRGNENRKGNGDSSLHKPTSLLSGGKYINVPDEWYSLPVDEKYKQTYVTLAILQDEKDFVMGELKRISDSSQVPFPNPFDSVERLLSVCLTSDGQSMSSVDKHNYIKGLQSWALHFAVTGQQRSNTEALFTTAEKEIEL